jgi:transposase InsO family protein
MISLCFQVRAGNTACRHIRALQHAVTPSMSRKGDCLDNAVMESFFGTLKAEFYHLNEFKDLSELQKGIRRYIHYYNHDRIKLKLGGLNPVEYRAGIAPALLNYCPTFGGQSTN